MITRKHYLYTQHCEIPVRAPANDLTSAEQCFNNRKLNQ